MLIALYGQHDFLARKAFLQGRSLGSLRLVPLAIVLWRRVNVVCGWIAIPDLHSLPCHHAEHVRMIFTSALIQYDRILWKSKSAVAQPFFHIHEDVGQVAASYDEVFCCVRSFAVSILTHVNLRRLRSYAFELHSAADGGGGGGINRGGRRRCSGARGPGLFFRRLLLAAAPKCEDPRQNE